MKLDALQIFFLSANPKHLTTFVLDRKDAMITVDDGIRKLKLLDAKGKVWTQDMILQVDDRSVSLIDLESKASSSIYTIMFARKFQISVLGSII